MLAVPSPVDSPGQWLRAAAYHGYYWLNERNHEHQLWARRRRAHGVRFRSYEPLSRHCRDELLGALCDRLDHGDVFFDVGANTGVYTLTAAASDPTVRVAAFEPNPAIADQLRTNVACNDFESQVAVHEIGVGDATRSARFYASSYGELGSFRERHAARWGARVADELTVSVRRLDDLLAAGELPPPDHIKIDVEGFGREVLAGATTVLARKRPVVYFEPHAADGTGETDRTDWLFDLFEELGYERERVAEGWVFDP